MKLSVVIPTLGRSPHLRGLLERLQIQRCNFEFETLVVANLPLQSLRQLVQSMRGNFEYLETGRLGVNLARNKGFEKSRGEVVLFLDDDAIIESDSFLQDHFSKHLANPEATAIGGPYTLVSSANQWDLAYHQIAHRWLRRSLQDGNQTSQLLGGNMSLKRSQVAGNRIRFNQGHPFDEVIAFGGAESGLCQRIACTGGILLFFADLAVGHSPQLSRKIFCKKAFLQGAGARYLADHAPTLNLTYANEWMAKHLFITMNQTYEDRLYRRCFEFGYAQNSYGGAGASKVKGPAPTLAMPRFSAIDFFFFRVGRLEKLVRLLRRIRRSIYTCFRSAWLNSPHSSH